MKKTILIILICAITIPIILLFIKYFLNEQSSKNNLYIMQDEINKYSLSENQKNILLDDLTLSLYIKNHDDLVFIKSAFERSKPIYDEINYMTVNRSIYFGDFDLKWAGGSDYYCFGRGVRLNTKDNQYIWNIFNKLMEANDLTN